MAYQTTSANPINHSITDDASRLANVTITSDIEATHVNSCYSENIVCLVLATFGLAGNILSITVIHYSGIKTSYSFLLGMLSVADALQLLGTIVHITKDMMGTQSQCGPTFNFNSVENIVISVIYLFCDIAQLVSHWLLVQLSVDRYIAICRPFKAAHWCTVPRSTQGLLAIIACSIVMTIPHAVDLLINHTLQHNKVYIIADMTVRYYLPVILLLVLNIRLIFAIRRVARRSFCQNHNNRSASVNLIVVVVVFLICGTCRGTDLILYYAVSSVQMSRQFLSIFSSVTYVMMIFNSAINFLVYCMFYRKFRNTLKGLFCKITTESANFSTVLN